jgi:hypothetical protein
VSLRGFWNKKNAANKKDKSVLRVPARPEPPQETWRDRTDIPEVLARAEKALCTKVSHRDS